MFVEDMICVRSPATDSKGLKTAADTPAPSARQIIDIVSENGGHLASNLGMVELTLALHRVLMPPDKIIFDVGQCYAHKLLTDLQEDGALRQYGGASGFPNWGERADATARVHRHLRRAGHGARGFKGGDEHIVAVVVGAFTGGLCYEALNNLGHDKPIEWCSTTTDEIAPNVGAMSNTTYMRTSLDQPSAAFPTLKPLMAAAV